MERLYSLLDAYNEATGADRPQIEARIWDTLGSEKTVLTLDMARFSMTVREHGIVYYMARVRKMQRYTGPVVAEHRGEVVKFEADNLLAAFDQPSDAVRAGLAIREALSETNKDLPGEPLIVSIGIAKGRILLIPRKDAFGDAVNIGHKLGEDVAGGNEILLTDDVHAAMDVALKPLFTRKNYSISGLPLPAWSSKR